MFLIQGTKRRASSESDNLGPPAKVQKRTSSVSEEETKNSSTSSAVVADDAGESDSQLSLASQPSQSEPTVVLSSPDNGSVSAEPDGEPLKSGEEIENDDDVFMETSDDVEAVIDDENSVIQKSAAMEDIEQIASDTKSAMEKGCNSPTMAVGSPEIPLQSSSSSPSRTVTESSLGHALTKATTEEDGQSVRESVSSEGEDEMEQEGDEAGDGTSSELVELAQQENSLHDHSYICQQEQSDVDGQSMTEQSSNIPVTSAELADHAYCNLTSPGSPHQQAAPQCESNDHDQTLTELRSKLSSDVQDHNYCRVHMPESSPAQEREVIVCDTEPGSDADNDTESQELFSVDVSQQNDPSFVDTKDCAMDSSDNHTSPSDRAVMLVHVGCQTSPYAQDTADMPTAAGDNTLPNPPDAPANHSSLTIDDSIKCIVDSMLAQDGLPTSTLWRVQQQLIRGLSLVSDRIEKLCSESL